MKKEYLVENFLPLISQYPKMPSQYFIENYTDNSLDASDYDLIKTAVHSSEDVEGLTKIGEVLLRIFNSHGVQNAYIAPLIYSVAKKVASD